MRRYRKPPGWPRYMEPRNLADGSVAYYWRVPTKLRKKGCTFPNEALGADYAEAKQRCDDILNPQLDAWRTGQPIERTPSKGTLDWLITEFYRSRKFTDLAGPTQSYYRHYLQQAAAVKPRKDYDRVGQIPLSLFTPAVADRIYERLLNNPDGTTRQTGASHAMRAVRRTWNVVYRAYPTTVPTQNPFTKMGLPGSQKTTKPASREQLLQFVAAADDYGHAPIGTAAFIAFEWLLREADLNSRFVWSDYRSDHRPDAVLLRHGKASEEIWLPLHDGDRILYPELEARLEATPRYGPLVIMRPKPDKKTKKFLPYKTAWFRHCASKIRDHAELPKDISFRSFRHGGLTELGDAELTD